MTAGHGSEEIVEAVERARYELLRGQSWQELRPQERATRLEMGRAALAAAGVLDRIAALEAEVAALRDGAGGVAAREQALAVRSHQLDQRQATLERAVAEHERAAAAQRDAVAAARSDAAAHAARADAAEDVIRSLRRTARPNPIDS